jgi:hypothetical protein
VTLDAFGGGVQSNFGTVTSGVRRRESGYQIALFAKVVEQLIAKLARYNQRETNRLVSHLAT